ncbi:MAG TPA: tetratricopeptide repeat protein [Pyrinomonadaceae bacterium]|jgi:tetratricopeptide (TPR) repeat protein|nr:tetratricopeptide repeat protein [Pyrinomonadaceae bacterium]
MFRRYFLPLLASVTLVALASIAASAQVGELRGHVTLKQADGTVVPAAGAQIDVFRVDMTGKYEIKTNKKGEFVFAGMFYAGEYVIAASMPGAQPSYLPGVKAGRDVDYPLELVMPGDGKRLTMEEARALATNKTPSTGGGGGAKESADDKAKRAELLKKNEEIAASNEKAKNSNEIVGRMFKAGNDALKAKNYDEAIARFDEGLQADPEHPGAPALLTNKTMALNARAVDRYNLAVKATDDAEKNTGMEAAKKDWTAASQSGAKAVALLKAMPTPTDPAEANSAKVNLYFALVARAEATRFFVVKVDQSQVDQGIAAYDEYMAAETDPVKKLKGEHDLAQMLFDSNSFDRALVAYQKILESNPDDLNALLRSGQALFNIGAINTDKAKYQEAANYLAKFVEKAPDTDPLKADAKAILDALKDQANVKPEKMATPTRRARKP